MGMGQICYQSARVPEELKSLYFIDMGLLNGIMIVLNVLCMVCHIARLHLNFLGEETRESDHLSDISFQQRRFFPLLYLYNVLLFGRLVTRGCIKNLA